MYFSEIFCLLPFVHLICMHRAVHARFKYSVNPKSVHSFVCTQYIQKLKKSNCYGKYTYKATRLCFKMKIFSYVHACTQAQLSLFWPKYQYLNLRAFMHIRENLIFRNIIWWLYMCIFHNNLIF